jgi:hypothetical protein
VTTLDEVGFLELSLVVGIDERLFVDIEVGFLVLPWVIGNEED